MEYFASPFDDSNAPPTADQSKDTSEPITTRPASLALAPILEMVSLSEFCRLGVVPVSYNAADHRLRLVCSGVVDETVRHEVSSRLPNINLEWYQADDTVFAVMVQRLKETGAHCEARDATVVSDSAPLDSGATIAGLESDSSEMDATAPPAETVHIDQTAPQPPPSERPALPAAHKTILFITPLGKISPHLQFALTAERHAGIAVSNQDQAAAALEQQPISAVFIHDNLVGRCERLVAHLQTSLPDTPVRYFSSELAILLNETRNPVSFDLVRQNLALFGRLSGREGSEISSHAANVARLADRMMVRLGVSDHCRLMVATAAFLHNIAEDFLTTTDGLPQTDIIRLSASKLESWGYPAPILAMLRRMYRGIGEAGLSTDGTQALGSSILTAADVFCHMWPDGSSVGRQLELVQRKIEDQLEWKVMPSIISALVDVICDDCTARMLRPNLFRINLLVSRGNRPSALIEALLEAEFTVTISTTAHECALNCRQAKSDMLVIYDSGSVTDIYDTLMSLALRGVAVDQLHTMLLIDESLVGEALRLLPHGVEEILPMTAPAPAISTMLTRIKTRLEEQYRHRVSAIERLGTHGSLSDMSLTDVLEIWRGNRRPARISVTAFGNQLTVYLDHGKVIAAECGECEGINALLRGVSWRQGIWNIDSIDASEMPEPNVDQTIDAVLIEACSRLDEVVRSEPACLQPAGRN